MNPNNKRSTALIVAIVVAVATLAGCAVPAPKAGETTRANWGPPRAAHRDLTYGPHAENTADVYLPTKGGNRGVIITVHGGGFIGGDRRDVMTTFGPILAQTHRGFAVVNISYRLQGRGHNPFPNAVDDVATAVNWVRTNGARYGMNPRTVIVAGHSAGGTLASLVGTTANGNSPRHFGVTAKVDGWVSVAGIHDFRRHTNHIVDSLGAAWLVDVRANAAPASTTTHLDRNDPPGYVIHGDQDGIVPVSQTHTLLENAASKGIGGRLYYDIVNTGGAACRNHSPKCGMNASIFNYWVDRIHDRAL